MGVAGGAGGKAGKNPNLRFVSVPPLPIPKLHGTPVDTLAAFKAFEYRGFDIGMGVASSLISRTGNSEFDPMAELALVEAAIGSAAAVFDFVAATLEDRRPDLVYLFNGRFSNSRAVMRACQRVGVPYRIHERGATRRRFSTESYMPHDAARAQEQMLESWRDAPDKSEAEAVARKWFGDRRAGKETNWLSFTTAQLPSHLPALQSGKIVTYFSSSDDEYAAIGDLYKWEGWKDQLDAVMGLVGVMQSMPGSHLVIRLHPHLRLKHEDERTRWLALQEKSEGDTVIAPELAS